jgi:hypothetical protein
MTTPFPIPRRRRVPALRPLARAACSGALLGLLSTACVISVHDHHDGHGNDFDECFDDFDDCLDDAEEPAEFDACESQLDACLDQHGDDEAGDGDGDADGNPDADGAPSDSDDGNPGDSQGDDEDPPHADTGDDEDPPHADTGDDEDPPRADTGDGDTSDPEPDCFEMLATCIDEAETLADVDACAAAFDHCIDPDPCGDPDCGCPQPQ